MSADFDAAVAFVRALPKDGPIQLDNAAKLEFYGLYKQATEGDVTGTQPWAVQFEARAKWDAWAANKGMAADEAKQKYVDGLTSNVEQHGGDWRKGPPTEADKEAYLKRKAAAEEAAKDEEPGSPGFYEEGDGCE